MAAKAKSAPVPSTNGKHVNRIAAAIPAESRPSATDGGAIVIPKPEILQIEARIRGLTPLMIAKFSQKAIVEIEESYAGKPKNKKKEYDPKTESDLLRHVSTEGWDGFHAASVRGAMISACRNVKTAKMTEMKQAIFVIADGHDDKGTPLVKIDCEDRSIHNGTVRLANGTAAVRNRPIYPTWAATVRLQVFAGLLSSESAVNLLALAGRFCGIGEWRPSSKESTTGSFGTFEIDPSVPVKVTKLY